MASENKRVLRPKFKTNIFDFDSFDSDDSGEFITPVKKRRKDPVQEKQVQTQSKLNDMELSLSKQNVPEVNKPKNVKIPPTKNKNESELIDRVNNNLLRTSESEKQSLINSSNNNICNNGDNRIMCSQVIQNENNLDAHTSNISENQTSLKNVSNFKLYIMKIVDELKNTLTKFVIQINHLQQKILKDEVASQQEADSFVFIIICIISKLKEIVNEQEKILTASSILKKNEIHNHEEYTQGKFCLNKNNVQLPNILSSHFNNLHSIKRSSDIVKTTIADSINHIESNYTQLNLNNETKKGNLPSKINYTSTSVAQNQKNTATSLISVLNGLKEITIIKKPVQESVGNFKNTKNKVDMNTANQKQSNQHSVIVDSSAIIILDHSFKENSLKNKSVLNRTISSSLDWDAYSTCSTEILCPIRSSNAQQSYKNKINTINRDKNKYGQKSRSLVSNNYVLDKQVDYSLKSTNLHHCDLNGTNLTNYIDSCLNKQGINKNSIENVQIDLEMVPLPSSHSTTSSAYILTETNKLKKNNSLKISPMITKKYRNNKKLFMICEVLLEKSKCDKNK